MTVRRATEADLPTLERFWRAFERELPPEAYVDVDHDRELEEIAAIVRDEIALLAEESGTVVGFALARRIGSKLGRLTDLYVTPEARRGGVARELVHEVAARLHQQGLEAVQLEVMASNAVARAVYARWGFREDLLTLVAPLEALGERLQPVAGGPALGVVFVQSDDVVAIERAAAAFAPRIGSKGSRIEPPANGWTAVQDDLATADPRVLRRLARELSDRLGAIVIQLGIEGGAAVRLVALERGSVVDEYLSVPEFHGPLPPGDVVALAANPTVLARVTGADPGAIRATARTASSLAELPPAEELARSIATALGLPLPER